MHYKTKELEYDMAVDVFLSQVTIMFILVLVLGRSRETTR